MNLFQRSRTAFSCVRFSGFFAFKEGMYDTQISAVLSSPTVSLNGLTLHSHLWHISKLGALCEKDGWGEIIHRRKRCDLSLFQLGLRILEHFLNEELPIPVQFHITI